MPSNRNKSSDQSIPTARRMLSFLTTRQVAEMLNIHPATVRHYAKTGKLKSKHVGKYYRFSEEAVEQFIGENGNV